MNMLLMDTCSICLELNQVILLKHLNVVINFIFVVLKN